MTARLPVSPAQSRDRLGDQVLTLKYQFDAELERNAQWTPAQRLDAWDALLVRLRKPLAEYERMNK